MAVIDNLKYLLTVENDDQSFSKAERNLKSLGTAMKALAVAGTSIFAFTKLTTDQIAETDRLAKSVGTTADIAEAFGIEMKKIGLSQENFIDLMEEMNNKLGEMKGLGEFTAVEESLQILNLKFSDLKNLSPEKQFQAITKASLEMADAQKAVTAVDMLMGGEANKLLGSMREQGLTYEDIIRKQQLYNFQTEETRKNAVKFADATNDLLRIFSSMSKALAGTLGGAMSETVNQFMEFIAVNKEIIKLNLKEFAEGLSTAISGVWVALRSMWSVLSSVVDLFGGFGKVAQFIVSGLLLAGVTRLIAGFGALLQLIRYIPLLLKRFLPIAILTSIFDDLRMWVSGGNSIAGLIVGDFGEWLPKAKFAINVIKNVLLASFEHTKSLFLDVGKSLMKLLTTSAKDVTGFIADIGDSILSFILKPINFVIDALNKLFGGLNKIGQSEIFKSLGADFNVTKIENISTDSAKQAMGNIVSPIMNTVTDAGSTVLNATTDIVVNVANATSLEAENLVKKAIVTSMEFERQKLQSPTK